MSKLPEKVARLNRDKILDEAITAVKNTYQHLGNVYTSLDMYNGAVDAIEKLKGEQNEKR